MRELQKNTRTRKQRRQRNRRHQLFSRQAAPRLKYQGLKEEEENKHKRKKDHSENN